jgi:uncharacterized protein
MAEQASTLTFFSKDPISCPICETSFYREEMRTGRGRMIAGGLTDELRRNYEPSKKYGEVFPLIYPITVCPSCFYAAYPDDFLKLPLGLREKIRHDSDRRRESIVPIFGDLDFTEPRGLDEGCASYYFAVMCYDYFPKEFSPTFKQGLSSLRAAWLADDLHRKNPNENYDYLSKILYRKACFFYNRAVELEQKGKESLSAVRHLGPDLDKNYGYDGVLYLSGLLEFRYGQRGNKEKRLADLDRSKRTVAKIFGMGKASKNKPTAILDAARDVYDEITAELNREEEDAGA